jgi:hypothetical protein
MMDDTSSAQQDTPITLPFTWQKDLMPEITRQILTSVCVPFERAEVGDIVAVPLSTSYYDSVNLYPITQALIKASSDTTRMVSYFHLNDTQRPVFADVVMRLMCHDMGTNQMAAHMEKMSVGAGEREYFDTLYTPGAVFICYTNYMDEVFQGRYLGEDAEQCQFNEAMVMLADPAPEASGHEHLALLKALPTLAQMFINATPVEDEETGDNVLVALPEFTLIKDDA